MRVHVWSAVIVTIMLLLVIQLQRQHIFSSNILDLLPATEQDEVVENAVHIFTTKVGQKSLFLIGLPKLEQAKKASQVFYQSLLQSDVFDQLIFRIDESEQKKLVGQYFPFRYHLLSNKQSQWLQRGLGGKIIDDALKQIYSPLSGVNSALLAKDPLLLFPSFMNSLPRFGEKLALNGEMLVVKDQALHYVFIAGLSTLNAFAKADQEQLLNAISSAKKHTLTQFPTAIFLTSGMVKHASAARRQAEQEISTIGLGSIVGIIFLLGISFRSIVPLTLSLLAIGCGIACGLAISLLLFEKLHLLTLVFGASLIGVSIDYSFHFFSDRVISKKDWSPKQCLKRIMPGITLGLITSICGYLGLLVTPFPGLQQMAVFSSVGLLAAYATVVCWFPFFVKAPSKVHQPWLMKPALIYLNYWKEFKWNKSKFYLVIFTLVVLSWGINHLKPNDDIRLLQNARPGIIAQDSAIQALTQQARATQFFLVEGESVQQLLENEEAFTMQLELLKQNKQISGYQSISSTLPSIKKQQNNYELIKKQLFESGQIINYMSNLGFSNSDIVTINKEFTESQNNFLKLSDWQQTSLGKGLSHLWLGETPRGVATIILLSDVQNIAVLNQLENQFSQVSLINIAGDVSNIFKRYRILVSYLVFASYSLIFLLLLWRYGYQRAWVIMLPPVIAALVSLAWFGLSGQLFNLFNVLALIIVLAIGIDYSLFFEEGENHQEATMLAILLSALTTLLSFGLLALSTTPAISAFGQTMLVGITTAFLLSPLVFSLKSTKSVENIAS